MGSTENLVRIRFFLAWIYLLGSIGTGLELILLEHFEDFRQGLPLGILAVGVAGLLWAWRSRRPLALRTFQGLMIATLSSASLGLYFHGVANLEFEREIAPDLTGWALFWKSLHGAAPPALAPLAMALLGAVGLLWAYGQTSTSER